MDKQRLMASVRERSGLSHEQVESVLNALRESDTSVMVIRKNEDRSAPVEQRRTIYLCG